MWRYGAAGSQFLIDTKTCLLYKTNRYIFVL